MNTHKKEWLVFAMLPGLGCISAHKLLAAYPCPATVLQLDRSQLIALRLPAKTVAAIVAYQQQDAYSNDYIVTLQRWLEDPGNHLISFADDSYPPMLRNIADPPLLLYIRGNLERLHYPQIAIVGSRSASKTGLQHAYNFGRALTQAGLTITSGLALGVDGEAHRACVELKAPTIAVLGNGLERIYPRHHARLAEDIVAMDGALISEYPLGTPPLARNFPKRNRIISGLSAGVLVVEVANKSGSLITARMALEQGREVFALPGTLNNPQSHGCHALIREGAILVETVAHILEPLAAMLGGYEPEEQKLAPESIQIQDSDAQLLAEMGYQVCTLDELVESTGKHASELIPQLVAMELSGYIEKRPDGYLRLI
ncbi:MAG: DNA-processing protein DprA [Amphritea sp.]